MTETIKICASCCYREKKSAADNQEQLSRAKCGDCGQVGRVYVFTNEQDEGVNSEA